jgi:hypothetical protein
VLQTWLEKQPPGPLHAIACPGTHRSVDPSSVAHAHAPYPVPDALHTWFEMHPPGPVQAMDWPGTHELLTLASTDELASTDAQSHGP